MKLRVFAAATAVLLLTSCGPNPAEQYLKECLAQEEALATLEIWERDLGIRDGVELMIQRSDACYEEAGIPRD